MKGNLLVAAFAALFSTSIHAHPRLPEPLHFQVSIDVAEVADDPTFAVLFFEGTEISSLGEFYTRTEQVACSSFIIDEPDVEVQSVTLYTGSANCSLSTASVPLKTYDLISDGTPQTETIDPPAVFVAGECCIPVEEDGHTKLGM